MCLYISLYFILIETFRSEVTFDASFKNPLRGAKVKIASEIIIPFAQEIFCIPT